MHKEFQDWFFHNFVRHKKNLMAVRSAEQLLFQRKVDSEYFGADELRNSILDPGKTSKFRKRTQEKSENNISLIENEHGFELKLNELDLTHPIIVKNCTNFVIVGNEGQSLEVINRKKDFLTIIDCQDFRITGCQLESGKNAVVISNSQRFLIDRLKVDQFEGYGLIVHESEQFIIENCNFTHNLASGIFIIGQTEYGLITRVDCTNSKGWFNKDAGLHICHCSPAINLDHIPDNCHEAKSIAEKTRKPKFITVENSNFSQNRAQGIYLEGAQEITICNNMLVKNNKEGICFDWGTVFCCFENNIISRNGQRAAMNPQEIKIDFISDFPLLDDGSSSCKLAGLSFDNGCLNLVRTNKIFNNFGGGVDFIRSCTGNIILENEFSKNNQGNNQHFPSFAEIAFMGIGALQEEFGEKQEKQLMDFKKSTDNMVKGNQFESDAHPVSHHKKDGLTHSDNITQKSQRALGGRLFSYWFNQPPYQKRRFEKKTLYIHIGIHKTGTTSLQKFLSINRQKLEANGLYYPVTNKGTGLNPIKHAFLEDSIRRQRHNYFSRQVPIDYSVIDSVAEEILSKDASKAIISDENFYNGGIFHTPKQLKRGTEFSALVLKRFRDFFNVKIIVFLRRQDQWLEAQHAQFVRYNNMPITFENFLHRETSFSQANFQEKLLVWEKHFGKPNIIVKVYDSKIESIEKEILRILGITDRFNLIRKSLTNVTLPAEAIEFIRQLNLRDVNLNMNQKNRLDVLLKKICKGPKPNYLSSSTRASVLEKFSAGNKNISVKYESTIGSRKTLFEPIIQNSMANVTKDNLLPDSRKREIFRDLFQLLGKEEGDTELKQILGSIRKHQEGLVTKGDVG